MSTDFTPALQAWSEKMGLTLVRYKKVLDSPKDLVTNDELLAQLDKLPK